MTNTSSDQAVEIETKSSLKDPSRTSYRPVDYKIVLDDQQEYRAFVDSSYGIIDHAHSKVGCDLVIQSDQDNYKDEQSRVSKKSNKRLSRKKGLDVSSQESVQSTQPRPITASSLSSSQIMNPARLFIASLGNPPPYASTRHSAGHILIKSLQSQLMFPPFQKSRVYGGGLSSIGADIGRPEFTLWQSPSLMNVSGVALLKAYKAFASATQTSPADPLPGLVVLYDEMETAPSQLRLRRGATSAKGHNGLKSVQQTLQAAGLLNKLGDRYVKIGIGIGRPAGGSRSSDDVSKYVLGQLTGSERQAIDAKIDDLVVMLDGEVMRMSG